MEEKRTVCVENDDEYEVTHSLHIGDREVLFCENMRAQNNAYYLVAFNQPNEIFNLYTDAVAFDDYLEAMSEFTGRVTQQIEKVQEQRKGEIVDFNLIQEGQCFPPQGEDFNGKVVVLKASAIRGEYRTLSHQIVLCTGGNGAKAHGYGSKVFTTTIDTSQNDWYRRTDIMGEIKAEHIPQWAKDKLEKMKQNKGRKIEAAQR